MKKQLSAFDLISELFKCSLLSQLQFSLYGIIMKLHIDTVGFCGALNKKVEKKYSIFKKHYY